MSEPAKGMSVLSLSHTAAALWRFAPQDTLASVKHAIVQTALESILAQPVKSLIAVVISGSMARDEHTVLVADGFAKVLGDAEFYLVFDRLSSARAFETHANLSLKEIEKRLLNRGIRCKVSFALPTTKRFERMSPHIMGYELRTTGKVVWGDADILRLIPNFGPAEIPSWDAWRSVSNRMIEQLGYAGSFESQSSEDVFELLYRCLKIQLELATLVTHFCGVFRPTYGEREQAIRELEARSALPSSFGWWREFAARVEMVTAFKLQRDNASLYLNVLSGRCAAREAAALIWKECQDVVSLVRSVWFWGAQRMLGCDLGECDDPLRVGLAIARRQSWRWRGRGWAQLLLGESEASDIHFWSRFLRLGRLGGPRFLTYAVAAALYFSWPDQIRGDLDSALSVAARAVRYLPILDASGPTRTGWIHASETVFAGWHQHLAETWA